MLNSSLGAPGGYTCTPTTARKCLNLSDVQPHRIVVVQLSSSGSFHLSCSSAGGTP